MTVRQLIGYLASLDADAEVEASVTSEGQWGFEVRVEFEPDGDRAFPETGPVYLYASAGGPDG